MEKSLEAITKWLKQSGLKVNQEKTELWLFHKNFTVPVKIKLDNALIKSKATINVLEVLFDFKLHIGPHNGK
jgi:hypothetical protein